MTIQAKKMAWRQDWVRNHASSPLKWDWVEPLYPLLVGLLLVGLLLVERHQVLSRGEHMVLQVMIVLLVYRLLARWHHTSRRAPRRTK